LHHKRVEASFYRSDSGDEPVRDWLKSLPPDDRRAIGFDLKTIEYGWPVGMPICRSLGDGLWEVRSTLPGSSRIARVLFCFSQNRIVLLHGFIKKTQKTPQSDLAIARSRKKETMSHE
jgi:phage-related protein